MKVMVINLDRAPERLERIRTIFNAAGVPFERMRAVDGRELTQAEIDRWRQGEPRFYLLGPGETGCFLSHRQCWEIAARTGEPVVIFEDDIHLGRDAAELLGDPSWIPADAHLIKIDTHLRTTMVDREYISIPSQRRLSRLRAMHVAAAGYVVTPAGASLLLDRTSSFSDPVDQFMFNPKSSIFDIIVTYQMIPAISVHNGLSDDVENVVLGSALHEERRLNRRRGFAKIRRELTRPLEQAKTLFERSKASFLRNQESRRIEFE
jgi:glycosyl transferase family 25